MLLLFVWVVLFVCLFSGFCDVLCVVVVLLFVFFVCCCFLFCVFCVLCFVCFFFVSLPLRFSAVFLG